MVGHEAVGQDAHGGADIGLGHHVEEGVVIVRLMKDRAPPVAPVEDVVGITSWAQASGSGHSTPTGKEGRMTDSHPMLSSQPSKIAMSRMA